MREEKGFTLLELLVSIGIIGLLASMGVMSYSEYRSRAADASVDSVMHNAWVALTAGQTSLDGSAPDWFWAWIDPSGTMQGWRINEFLPGFKTGPKDRVSIWYDQFCESGAWCPPGVMCCVVASAHVWHCDSNITRSRMRWNDGTTMEFEWPGWGC